jgi:small conductance mechanosensitive channel
MVKVLMKILKLLMKKEVYGTVIILAVSYFVYHTLSIIVEDIFNKSTDKFETKKRNTVIKLFKNITKYIIILICLLALLSLYGINVKAMVAGVGIAGTILGLALQDTFKDFIGGISILTENYFIVGDIVRYNDFTGEVVEFGLKSTKIRNVSGETLIVANRNIYEIGNLSQSSQKVMININVAYEEKIENVEKVIKNKILPAINKIENVKEDSAQYLGVNELADSCVKYLILFRCNRETQWQAKRDALRQIKLILDNNKIKIPYPQLEVHNEK